MYNTNSTADVHSKTANSAGLYDMSGNVWEWCWGTYSASSSGRLRRGGSWLHDAALCAVARRISISPAYRFGSFGFRLVRSAQ